MSAIAAGFRKDARVYAKDILRSIELNTGPMDRGVPVAAVEAFRNARTNARRTSGERDAARNAVSRLVREVGRLYLSANQ